MPSEHWNFTVFIPCWQVLRHQSLQQETLNAIATWEARTRHGGDGAFLQGQESSTRQPTTVAHRYDGIGTAERGHCDMTALATPSVDSLFTMHALEHTLELNPEPLRRFASLRDFTGENIAFLIAVREWKALWPKLGAPPNKDGKALMTRRELYKRGIRLYANFVSPRHAVFPLNLSAGDYQKLQEVFGAAARLLYGDSEESSLNEITPFSNGSDPLDRLNTADSSKYGEDSMFSGPSYETQRAVNLITEKVQFWGFIPTEFSRSVFDGAEKSIKYLVLTNTWPKYIREYRPSSSDGTSGGSRRNKPRTPPSPVSKFFGFRSSNA